MNREIIVNGLRYRVGPYNRSDKTPRHYKGFGGHRYTVRFKTGELLQVDDLLWDYTFKNHSRPDTAVILDGWTYNAPTCVWQDAGEYQVFGPIK